MDIRERVPFDNRTMMEAVLDGRQVSMWTALPGIIQGVDLAKHTVTVQPAIQALVALPDGTKQQTNMPLLSDVPIVWPRGGTYAMTFPVAVGDECLVVFSSRCIDNWWQEGGVQPQYEQRLHDLSDGFAIPGPYSQKNVLPNVSANTTQLRSADGTLFVEVDVPNKKARVVSNTVIIDVDSNSGKISITAPTAVDITAPLTTIHGNLDVTQALRWGTGGTPTGAASHRHGLGTPVAGTGPPSAGT